MERGSRGINRKLKSARMGHRKAPNAESDGETSVVVPIDYITCEVQIQCGVPGEAGGEGDGVNRNAGVVCNVTLVWVQRQRSVIGVVLCPPNAVQ
jgi:hypothetical protein